MTTITAKKKLNPLNTERCRTKLKSDIGRLLYYMAVGYDGPHPWGSMARPPYPEFSPLVVKDIHAEKQTRETIEKFMNDPEWTQLIGRLLRELNRKL